MDKEKKGLARELGLSECITITAGAVIGVGLFTVGSAQVGVMGSSVIIASVIAFLLVLWPSAIYGELGATLPLAGGTYSFAKRAINWPVAIFCSWHYTLAQIGIAGGEALAFASYFSFMLKALGLNVTISPKLLGCALMLLFTVINYRGIKFSGKWQNAFMFFFWGASLVWMIMVMRDLDFTNFAPVFSGIPVEYTAFAKSIIMVWWCFAGFETCVGMGGEVKFPQLTLPRALTLSPFVVFAVNALFQFFLVGLTPIASQALLSTATAPFVAAMTEAGIVGFPFILLCLAITFGGDFSSMIPCTGGAARYMYIMAEDGCFPKIFSHINPKFRSPDVSVITVGIVGMIFILTNSIVIVAAMCAFSQLLAYVIGYISYLMLYKKEPDLERPYKVPAGKFGAVFSIIAYSLLAILAIDWNAIWWNIGLSVLCIIYIVFFIVIPKRPVPTEEVNEELLAVKTAQPSTEEKAGLDAEYKKWQIGAYSGFAIACVLFIMGFIL